MEFGSSSGFMMNAVHKFHNMRLNEDGMCQVARRLHEAPYGEKRCYSFFWSWFCNQSVDGSRGTMALALRFDNLKLQPGSYCQGSE